MVNKPEIFLCWFHVQRNWLQKAITKVHRNPERRKALLKRCSEILQYNLGAGTGVAFALTALHHRIWRPMGA